MVFGSKKRKKTLDERCDELKKRLADRAAALGVYWLDPAVRADRLLTIRGYLGLTQTEMALRMGMCSSHYALIERKKMKPAMTVVKLAEVELNKFRTRKWKDAKKAAKAAGIEKQNERVPVPAEMRNDTKLRAQALAMHVRGKTLQEIGETLALRPQIVQYFIDSLDTE